VSGSGAAFGGSVERSPRSIHTWFLFSTFGWLPEPFGPEVEVEAESCLVVDILGMRSVRGEKNLEVGIEDTDSGGVEEQGDG